MIAHICKTNGWEMEVFNQVDWEAHHQAVMNSDLPSTFINKYLHNILPTGKVIHKHQKYHNHCCPSCGEPFEDRFHLLRCQHFERKKWSGNLSQALRDFCKRTHVSGEMTHLIVEGVYWEMQDSPLENIQQYPSALQPLINSQNNIGWDQFFKGRLSKLWRIIHLQHLKDKKCSIDCYNSGIGWTSTLIRIVFTHVHEVWRTRNLAKHGETLAEQIEKKRLLCASEISTYYDCRDNDELADDFPSNIFYSSFQEHMHKEPSFQELDNWLGACKQLILHSKRTKTTLEHQNEQASGGCNQSSGAGAAP